MKIGCKGLTRSILSFVLTVTCLLSISVAAFADKTAYRKMYEILTDSGNSSLPISGDGASDIVSIATSLKGKTYKDFGHKKSDNWCAVFIQHCAYLACQASADGATGNFGKYNTGAGNFAKQVLSKGGSLVYAKKSATWQGGKGSINSGNKKGNTPDAKPGDIVLINWNGKNTGGHVELVYKKSGNTIYTIGGNTGTDSGKKPPRVWTHSFGKNNGKVVAIVRPKYIEAKAGKLTVFYDTNGGKTENFTETGKNSIKVTSEVPKRSGYAFAGWSTNPGKNGKVLKAGASVDFSGQPLEVAMDKNEPIAEQKITLYAHWVNDYLKKCTKTDTYLSLKAKNSTVSIMTFPCNQKTCKDSTQVRKLEKGEILTTTAIWKNSEGNYWYEVTAGDGETGYVYGTGVTVTGVPDDIVSGNVKISTSKPKVKSAIEITGTLKSNVLKMTKVTGTLTGSNGKKQTATIKPKAKQLTIAGSSIATDLKFESLSHGPGTLRLTVTLSGQYTDGSKLISETWTTKLDAVKFTEIGSYKVNFDANGGSGAPAAVKKTDLKELKLPTTKPKYDGYDFLGWARSKTATKAEVKAGGTLKLDSTNGKALTLYAVWAINKGPTLTYDANGGSGAPAAQTADKNGMVSIREQIPSRDGYYFFGWLDFDEPNDPDIDQYYGPGESIPLTESRTLHAIWENKKISNVNCFIDLNEKKVSVHGSGGVFNTYDWVEGTWNISDLTKVTIKVSLSSGVSALYPNGLNYLALPYADDAFTDAQTLKVQNGTAEGYMSGNASYMILPKYVKNYGNGYFYTNAPVIMVPATPTGTKTLTIQYFLVKFDPNGGTHNTQLDLSDDGCLRLLATSDISALDPLHAGNIWREGYTFLGWSENRNAQEPTYTDVIDLTGKTNDLTLYAVWAKDAADDTSTSSATANSTVVVAEDAQTQAEAQDSVVTEEVTVTEQIAEPEAVEAATPVEEPEVIAEPEYVEIVENTEEAGAVAESAEEPDTIVEPAAAEMLEPEPGTEAEYDTRTEEPAAELEQIAEPVAEVVTEPEYCEEETAHVEAKPVDPEEAMADPAITDDPFVFDDAAPIEDVANEYDVSYDEYVPDEEPAEEYYYEEAPAPVPATVLFLVDPYNAEVHVYSWEGEVWPDADGSYLLLAGEYSYTVTADGYEPIENGIFTVAESDWLQREVTMTPAQLEEVDEIVA